MSPDTSEQMVKLWINLRLFFHTIYKRAPMLSQQVFQRASGKEGHLIIRQVVLQNFKDHSPRKFRLVNARVQH